MGEKRRVPVSFEDLIDAFVSDSMGIDFYLDLETGAVLFVTEGTRTLMRSLEAELYNDAGECVMALDKLLAQHPEIYEWQKDNLRQVDHVDRHYGNRVIAISGEPYSDYNDMERFVYTIQDERLFEKFNRAIRGRGAFRRFKVLLAANPALQDAWYDFKDARIETYVRDWLEANDIEPLAKSLEP